MGFALFVTCLETWVAEAYKALLRKETVDLLSQFPIEGLESLLLVFKEIRKV